MKKYFLLLTLCSFIACHTSENKKLILGHWQAVEWLVDGTAVDRDIPGTTFMFNDKGEYVFTNNGNTEKGTYKVDEDELYTTPDKQQEIKVRIARITKDTLIFDMNRGGAPELLTLIHQ